MTQKNSSTHTINNYNTKDIINNKPIDESKRGFLKKIGIGSAALALASKQAEANINFSYTDSTITELPTSDFGTSDSYQLPTYTISDENLENIEEPLIRHQFVAPQIPTRLFSSSNASSSNERNRFALQRLAQAGFAVQNPQVMDRKYYRFGGTDKQRADDFNDIAHNPTLAPRLLLGVRGGYGAMRILEDVNWSRVGSILRERSTILGGFSDVTAIQCALLAQGGMGSFNLPMAYSEFGKYSPDTISCEGFVKCITESEFSLYTHDSAKTHSYLPTVFAKQQQPVREGVLWGGNLSVLASLAGTPYMPRPHGGIVFIEEVGEQPYRIERMLYDLHLAGAFKNQQAIVFGSMARCGRDSYDSSYNVATVIRQLQKITNLPIYCGVQFGHISKKQSFPMGFFCTLTPSRSGFTMTFTGHPTIDKNLINPYALSAPL